MIIKFIFLIKNSSIIDYTTDEISIQDILNGTTLNSVYYINCKKNNIESKVYILDLMKLLTETVLGQCATWESFLLGMTDELFNGYLISEYTESCEPVIHKNMMPQYYVPHAQFHKNEYFTWEYTSINNPSIINNTYYLHSLTDLVITKTQSTVSHSHLENLDLNKCLVIINGHVVYTMVIDNKLYVINGCKYLLYTTIVRFPEVIILDTSNFGGFRYIPLCDTNNKILLDYTGQDRENSALHVDTIVQHDAINFNEQYPWLILDNAPYFKDIMHVIKKDTFIFKPSDTIIHKSYIKKMHNSNSVNTYTNISEGELSISDYYISQYNKHSKFSSFLILFNSPYMFIKSIPCVKDMEYHSLRIKEFNNGILFQSDTRSFRPYKHEIYKSGHLLYINDTNDYYYMDNYNHSKLYGMDSFKRDVNKIKKIIGNSVFDSDYFMLDFSPKKYI